MVLHPDKRGEAEAVFRRWGLDFAVIGRTTDSLRFVVRQDGVVKADLPIRELGDQAPLYDRPYAMAPALPVIEAAAVEPPCPVHEALLALMGSADLCSKRWVYEQYDHLIGGDTVAGPGGDAAVIRIADGPKGLALTTDVTPRYCRADPVQGGRQAVAEAWRNLTAVGARPLALTDNLNFGNPEKREAMGELVGCVRGIGEAARALDFPIVSGNVSLYNETTGQGILPTPTIGGVGLVADVRQVAASRFLRGGDTLILIGDTAGWLGQSVYLRDVCGRLEGAPPPVDLVAERRNGDYVRGCVADGVRAVHDLSDGGLAVAVAEMALRSGIGARITTPPAGPAHAVLFGEDQARYLLAVAPADADRLLAAAAAAGVPARAIGTTGGDAVVLGEGASVPLATLRAAHERFLPDLMGAVR